MSTFIVDSSEDLFQIIGKFYEELNIFNTEKRIDVLSKIFLRYKTIRSHD